MLAYLLSSMGFSYCLWLFSSLMFNFILHDALKYTYVAFGFASLQPPAPGRGLAPAQRKSQLNAKFSIHLNPYNWILYISPPTCLIHTRMLNLASLRLLRPCTMILLQIFRVIRVIFAFLIIIYIIASTVAILVPHDLPQIGSLQRFRRKLFYSISEWIRI